MWGQCQCGELLWLWICGVQESGVLKRHGRDFIKVRVRIRVAQVIFLSLHLSAFCSSVCSATATEVVGECWHLKNEEPDQCWCSAFKITFIFRCPVLKILFWIVVVIVLWNSNWTVGFSIPEVVSPSLRSWL